MLVDADHGYGNALNVRRTVQELEAAGAAGLTIEDTLLPQAFGVAEPQLISLEEGVGKMKAALDGRSDPSLVIMGRTGRAAAGHRRRASRTAIARAKAYEATGVDALFFTGLKTRRELEAIAAATTLPIVLGNTQRRSTIPPFSPASASGSHCRAMRRSPPRRRPSTRRLKALREGTRAERI